jgi:ferredoxin-NADP reductase
MGAIAHETTFMSRLKGREEAADRTMAFRFEKPRGFTFKPGQYLDITLEDPPQTDSGGNTRTFSIASAPDEDTLLVATRMRGSAFKRVLADLPLDSPVKIEGPFGNLTMHTNASRPAVLLAGGIGITPFRGMILRAAREKLKHHIVLFYSNRRPEDAPFLEELQSAEKANPNYRFVGTMTAMEKSRRSWQGENGHITADLLRRHLKGVDSAIYYIAGPPAMVAGLQGTLQELNVNEDDIRTEEFAGY